MNAVSRLFISCSVGRTAQQSLFRYSRNVPCQVQNGLNSPRGLGSTLLRSLTLRSFQPFLPMTGLGVCISTPPIFFGVLMNFSNDPLINGFDLVTSMGQNRYFSFPDWSFTQPLSFVFGDGHNRVGFSGPTCYRSLSLHEIWMRQNGQLASACVLEMRVYPFALGTQHPHL
jgi:hypothetical protein